VRGRERVVDVEVAQPRQLRDEMRIVLFLAGMKPRVLQAENVDPGCMASTARSGRRAEMQSSRGHRAFDDARTSFATGLSEAFGAAVRPAEMRSRIPCRLCRRFLCLETRGFIPARKERSAFRRAIGAAGRPLRQRRVLGRAPRACFTEGVAWRLPAYAGRTMQAELEALGKALEAPARPLAAIVRRRKISSKLDLLGNLLDRVDVLIIGGAWPTRSCWRAASRWGNRSPSVISSAPPARSSIRPKLAPARDRAAGRAVCGKISPRMRLGVVDHEGRARRPDSRTSARAASNT